MMVGAATVFVVSDIAKSIEHYCDALGFTVTFQYGEPSFYACLCRDAVALHLLAAHETKRLPGNGGICVFVKDVDGVQPVKIANTTECDNMQSVRIAGFGTTEVTGRYGFGTKRIADVVVVSSDGKNCNGQSYGADPGLEFVAEDRHADTCKGDSGGPAYLKSSGGE